VVAARSRTPAGVPDQFLRMALLAGLALWAVRASVWFGLTLPVAICALARERRPRPADADRGVPLASGLVLAALAVALAVALPPVSRAIVPDAASRPELTAAPFGRRRPAGGEPAARPDVQLPAPGLLPGVPAGPKDPAGGRLPHRAPPGGTPALVPGRRVRTLATGVLPRRRAGVRAPGAAANHPPGR
jgi:hypothetical protein